MRNMMRIFQEELTKAANAFASTYRTLQEIDARTMAFFLALLGRSK